MADRRNGESDKKVALKRLTESELRSENVDSAKKEGQAREEVKFSKQREKSISGPHEVYCLVLICAIHLSCYGFVL